jgi:UTP--glucose-1-phosphate uridylyltransferase
MNSLNTHQDVVDYLQDLSLSEDQLPKMFQQHLFPKILAETLEPASWPEDPDLEWNPPGHGDIYAALHTSGLLDELLASGKRYAFVSNADNLGAVIDPSILGHMVRNGYEFLMEVAQRTPADRKGGHLAFHRDGHLILREIAQCPEESLEAFQDIQRYSFFNTNSIWFDLQALKDTIAADGLPRLPLIVNPKHLNPRDEQSPRVYQLETAMGAALSFFESSTALQVSRDRFAPVKKTSDLLAVRSNCMVFSPTYQLRTNPSRTLPPIDIELDETFYKKVDQFEERFPDGPPDLLECASFKVQGDVVFESGTVCQGDVVVTNSTPSQQRVPAGTVLSGRTEW